MKSLINKLFSYSFSFFILFSCSSVPKEYLTNNDICHYNDPIFKITKDEMTFDVEKYKKELEKRDLVLVDNENFKKRLHIYSDGTIGNLQINKDLGVSKNLGYYPSGTISYIYFEYDNGSSKIGKETEYNQQDNITKIIDYEKGYKICWAEAIEIVKKIAKKDIKKYEIKEFYVSRNDLGKFPNARPLWRIGLMNGNKKISEHIEKKGKIRYVIV